MNRERHEFQRIISRVEDISASLNRTGGRPLIEHKFINSTVKITNNNTNYDFRVSSHQQANEFSAIETKINENGGLAVTQLALRLLRLERNPATQEIMPGSCKRLTEGKQPASVFKFCKNHGFKEDEFYQYFGSFEALEKAIWKNLVDHTRSKMTADASYSMFTTREKILTFYFMLAEALKSDRSFVLHQLKSWKKPGIVPTFLKGFKASFDEWINSVLNEGKASGEIAKRPYLDERYDVLFWLHLMFILQFWSHDESANFEKTDAAIEKSVNLAFDLIGKGVLDNALDFGKFLYQNSKN